MKQSVTRIFKGRQLLLIVFLVFFATAMTVWGSRSGSPAVAIGGETVGEATSQITEQLGHDYGELCGEYSASSIVGEAVATGLTPDSPVPSVLDLRAQGAGGTLGTYKQVHLNSDRVMFSFWTDKTPSQLREQELVAMAIEYQLILEDGEDTPEWTEIELEALYPC